MKVSKAKQEHIDKVRSFLQLTEQLSKIDTQSSYEWKKLKEDWEGDDDFISIIKKIEDENGFNVELYFDYFRYNISHLYHRILMGFEVLLDNCCNPEVDFLDFNDDIKMGLELLNKQNNHE